jgi:hypothetical protein
VWESWISVELGRDVVEDVQQSRRYVGLRLFELKEVVETWLLDTVGPKARFTKLNDQGSWHHTIPISHDKVTFFFKDPNHAMLFKLTFA